MTGRNDDIFRFVLSGRDNARFDVFKSRPGKEFHFFSSYVKNDEFRTVVVFFFEFNYFVKDVIGFSIAENDIFRVGEFEVSCNK